MRVIEYTQIVWGHIYIYIYIHINLLLSAYICVYSYFVVYSWESIPLLAPSLWDCCVRNVHVGEACRT